jgi:4-amino-4-deoxy-L-arabinose transferase-like glycosyltransferase
MTHMRATHVQITDFSETDREPLRPSGMADILFCLIPAMAAVALCIWFRPLLTSGLWWDEQWRAYHVLLPGFHLDLGGTYAPTSPAWLLVDKLFVVLLGVREWVLRIPSVVAWVLIGPLTYRLSRRVMGRLASLVAGIALGVTPAVLYFGTELKPYATETLATVAIILAWAKARETEGKGRLLWYGVTLS